MRDKSVAILESRLGQQLADLIAKRGGTPILAPALAETPDIDAAFIGRLIEELSANPPKLAIFQTGVGTQALFTTTDTLGVTDKLLAILDRAVVAVRGPKPTGVLRGRKVRIDLSAKDPFTTHEVIEALGRLPLAGTRAIVQKYGATNRELEEALKAAGAEVVEIPTYRWSLPEDPAPLLRLVDLLKSSESPDAVCFTSASQVENLFTVAADGRNAVRDGLNRTLVVSIGPVCSAALKKFGVTVGIEASPPKLGPMVAALDEALSR